MFFSFSFAQVDASVKKKVNKKELIKNSTLAVDFKERIKIKRL